jgi:hypothetical protein
VAHPELWQISSPLTDQLPLWRRALAGHPDQTFARYALEGIEHGFRVGFDHATALSPAGQNMPLARAHSAVITDYITGELAGGRMLGLFPPCQILGVHTNRMGVVPNTREMEAYKISPTLRGRASTTEFAATCGR